MLLSLTLCQKRTGVGAVSFFSSFSSSGIFFSFFSSVRQVDGDSCSSRNLGMLKETEMTRVGWMKSKILIRSGCPSWDRRTRGG